VCEEIALGTRTPERHETVTLEGCLHSFGNGDETERVCEAYDRRDHRRVFDVLP
jgi:hypothetical protein